VAYTLPLLDCTPDRAELVGGKAVGLSHLLRQARDVPSGFVVTTDAYRDWIATRGLERELERLLQGVTDAEAQATSREIQALFEHAEPTAALAAEVGRAYAELDTVADTPVAVRSSATTEDQADASFAGQQDTYLGVVGADSVLRSVIECWASLFTPHAITYRRRLQIAPDRLAMAVVVQRMVRAHAAGVMLTVDPVRGDRSQIAIEAVFGLGLGLVGGELTPDRFAVDKVTLDIRSRAIVHQPYADRMTATGSVTRVDLTDDEGSAPCISDEEVASIARIGKQTERALGGPVDVEWAIGPGADGPRHLYLLQARPETIWSRQPAAPVAPAQTTPMDRIVSMMLGNSRRKHT
jgi:rifampicin phosphotransferase